MYAPITELLSNIIILGSSHFSFLQLVFAKSSKNGIHWLRHANILFVYHAICIKVILKNKVSLFGSLRFDTSIFFSVQHENCWSFLSIAIVWICTRFLGHTVCVCVPVPNHFIPCPVFIFNYLFSPFFRSSFINILRVFFSLETSTNSP